MAAFTDAFRSKRVAVCIPLGFACGLPFSMRGNNLAAWMTRIGIDLQTVTAFTAFGLLFTLKPLWAPLIDRYPLPFLGRRRGWMLVMQLGLFLSIAAMGATDPRRGLVALAVLTAVTTFLTATQDIATDAYRVDLLPPRERASGSATFSMGYRIATLVSGYLALVMSDHLPWSTIYVVVASLMVVGLAGTLIAPEPEAIQGPRTIRAAIVDPLAEFFSRRGAVAAIAFIMLYKCGDYMAADVITPFLIKSGFTGTEIGNTQKLVGMIAFIVGVMVGAGLSTTLGIRRSLLLFGVAQASTNVGYLALAIVGKNMPLLVGAISVDWFCAGLAQAAFSAYQLSICSKRFSATQFALIASASTVVGRVVGVWNGAIIKTIGWPSFFVVTMVVAIPGLLLILFGALERAVPPAEPVTAPPAAPEGTPPAAPGRAAPR
jgi:PAT family beta-lactamase induction signal transducer AmpG